MWAHWTLGEDITHIISLPLGNRGEMEAVSVSFFCFAGGIWTPGMELF